jgi:predicted CoA-binding protein
MDPAITEFLERKRLAVVGVSRRERQFANAAYRELKERGYALRPVHLEMATFDGDACAPSLAALSGDVDAAWIAVAPARVPALLREAAAAGIRNVWLQQRAESPEALALARSLDLRLVSGRCILMYAEPVRSVHRWHRAIVRFFGGL